MSPHPDPEPRAFASADALDAWLAEHPAPHPGLWVKVAKKDSGIPSVTAAEVNDVALCHGWITGQRKGLDASSYTQRITPRRPGSLWSMVNVRRVAELAAEGRMRPAGLAEVDAAKADGRWEAAYESQRNAEVPDELAAALAENPGPGRPSSGWAGPTATSSCSASCAPGPRRAGRLKSPRSSGN